MIGSNLMNDLKKRQKLIELKKRYGFDIAVLKKTNEHPDLNDDELYKSLLLFDIQNKLTDSLNQYAEDVDFEEKELASLVTILLNSTGEILSNIARHNPVLVLLSRDIAINLFDKHLKDLLDGKPTN